MLRRLSCKDSHDDLLFEEGAIEGEGLIFPSLSANVHPVLLGELISEAKQHGQTAEREGHQFRLQLMWRCSVGVGRPAWPTPRRLCALRETRRVGEETTEVRR